MSFGTLGATSVAAADNAANLLAVLRAVQDTPKAVMTDLIAALENIVDERAALDRTLKDIAAAQAELEKTKVDVQSQKAALEELQGKMRKLIG